MSQIHLNKSDPALDVLQQRIFDAGVQKKTISYMKLVEKVKFSPETLGADYYVEKMFGVNAALVGEYLDYISTQSSAAFDFLASALVVRKSDGNPSGGFYELAKELNPSLVIDTAKEKEDFWKEELMKAYNHYESTSNNQVIF